MATWEGKTWSFAGPNDLIFMASAPASNSFQFEPLAIPLAAPYLYELVTVNPGDVSPFWAGLKLLPQEGKALGTKFPAFQKKATSKADMDTRIDKVSKELANHPYTYERLVGFVTFNGEDNPVTFYKLEKGFSDGKKTLLVALVNMIGASPSGVVIGNA